MQPPGPLVARCCSVRLRPHSDVAHRVRHRVEEWETTNIQVRNGTIASDRPGAVQLQLDSAKWKADGLPAPPGRQSWSFTGQRHDMTPKRLAMLHRADQDRSGVRMARPRRTAPPQRRVRPRTKHRPRRRPSRLHRPRQERRSRGAWHHLQLRPRPKRGRRCPVHGHCGQHPRRLARHGHTEGRPGRRGPRRTRLGPSVLVCSSEVRVRGLDPSSCGLAALLEPVAPAPGARRPNINRRSCELSLGGRHMRRARQRDGARKRALIDAA
jgi:hypothetical protein